MFWVLVGALISHDQVGLLAVTLTCDPVDDKNASVVSMGVSVLIVPLEVGKSYDVEFVFLNFLDVVTSHLIKLGAV